MTVLFLCAIFAVAREVNQALKFARPYPNSKVSSEVKPSLPSIIWVHP
jgi:hypothetical protein